MRIIPFGKTTTNYDLKWVCAPIKCDNTSAINLTNNSVLDLFTKNIEIRHHFLRDRMEKCDVIFEYVDIKNQLANIFIKSLTAEPFHKICRGLGILGPPCFDFILLFFCYKIYYAVTFSCVVSFVVYQLYWYDLSKLVSFSFFNFSIWSI